MIFALRTPNKKQVSPSLFRMSICIFHTSCPDGYSSAWIVRKKYPEIELWYARHEANPSLPEVEGKDVIFVHFCYKLEIMLDLVKKAKRAVDRIKAKTILLGGGVAANSKLREALTNMADSVKTPVKLLVAPKQYCTDNAVMVASLAYYKYKAEIFSDMMLEPKANSQ